MTGISRFTGAEIADAQELSEAITTILTTPKGSRVMRRDFGSDLPRLIDAPINGETLVDLYAAVAEALARWEPRIVLRRVQLADARAGQMRFAIDADTVAGPVTLDVAGAVA
jgi:phage baseplate assembly protein W